jgi:hypothetical protein
MAKISTYAIDGTPSLSDKLIGTEVGNNDETKNYLISDLASLITSQTSSTIVLNAQSTVSQAPSVLDTAIQITFGPAQYTSSDPVMIDALGNITFNESGLYIVNGYGSVERQGSSGGVAILLLRGLLNGSQALSTKAFHIDSTGLTFPYEITVPFQVTAGDIITFEIMRDSSGVNQGGLYPDVTLGPWSDVPSAEVLIWKIQ